MTNLYLAKHRPYLYFQSNAKVINGASSTVWRPFFMILLNMLEIFAD